MDTNDPFNFSWEVDQDGYEIRQREALFGLDPTDFVVARGGPTHAYQPFDDPTLWLQFGEICRDRGGVLAFAQKFGLLRKPNLLMYGALGMQLPEPGDRLALTLAFADRIRSISGLLNQHDRRTAMDIFNLDRPQMTEYIFWNSKRPAQFDYRWVPFNLRDAILHQAGDAITQNRQFRRCANLGCGNWFRLGPHQAQDGGGGHTITQRRRFCSVNCRVASAYRKKKEAAAHA